MVKGPEKRTTTQTNLRNFMEKYDSPKMRQLRQLFDSKQILAHKSNPFPKMWYDRGFKDIPNIGKTLTPYWHAGFGSLEDLKAILRSDLERADNEGENYFSAFESTGEPKTAAEAKAAAMDLINNIHDDKYKGTGFIGDLRSPALDKLATRKSVPEGRIMIADRITCTVLPSDSLIALEHNKESACNVGTLTGEVLWVIWPPTKKNLDVLSQAYEDVACGKIDRTFDIRDKLELGIMVGLLTDEGIHLPPFCILTGIAATTSVLASYSYVTPTNFTYSLSMMGLQNAWMKSEYLSEQQLAAYSRAIPKLTGRILTCEFENDASLALAGNSKGPLKQLMCLWDVVKNHVAMGLRKDDAYAMRKHWIEFFVRVGCCAICDDPSANNWYSAGAHFDEKHWPRDIQPTIWGSMVPQQPLSVHPAPNKDSDTPTGGLIVPAAMSNIRKTKKVRFSDTEAAEASGTPISDELIDPAILETQHQFSTMDVCDNAMGEPMDLD